MGMKQKVILLNGPSSSGKSTLSIVLRKTLLQVNKEEYGVVSIDTFLKMEADQVIYEDDVYEISLKLCNAVVDMMKSKKGVIIDHVITSERIFKQMILALHDYDIYLIHVTCPMSELIRREKIRENRCLGSALASYQYLFPRKSYDITVDTFHTTVEECSLQIIETIKKKPEAVS